jgi:hypothetical protein
MSRVVAESYGGVEMTGKRFRTALDELEISPDDFAERCGIHRTTPYRWIRTDTVPKWATWIVSLLLERRMLSDQLSAPAE